jgi:hypothetical protein
MLIDISMDKSSLSIPVDNPFRLDLDAIMEGIGGFVTSKGATLEGIDVRGLLPRMVKGIAGCENGCPADAMSFVSTGFGKFELKYIEGGILSAKTVTQDGQGLFIKMFPDF